MSQHTDVFVIGAGPAGLTAAYCLTKENPSVIVIEKDPVYVGGISRTVDTTASCSTSAGIASFPSRRRSSISGRRSCRTTSSTRPRLSRIYYGGKYYSYPLSAFEALKNLGIFTSAACMLSFAYAKAFPIKHAGNFHEWVRNQFGERLFSIFFKTYTEKVWGMSCDEISADWAAQRIKGLDLGVAVIEALKKALLPRRTPKAGGPVVKTLIESFQYPRKGPGMMWEAAARKIQKRGGKVLKGRDLRRTLLRQREKALDHRSRASAAAARPTRRTMSISSAPVRELVEKICADADLAAACARAALPRFPHRRPDGEQAGSVPRQLDLHPRSVGQSRTRAELPLVVARNGAAGHELSRARIFLLRGRRAVERARRRTDRARQEGDRQDRPDRRAAMSPTPAWCASRRPIRSTTTTIASNVATIRRDLEGLYPTLHLVGRNGMHKYNNQDHAMMTAMLTAKNILAGERVYDIWNVNEDAEYHEAGGSGAKEALGSERLVPQKAKPETAAA